jgi:hypothetical protein
MSLTRKHFKALANVIAEVRTVPNADQVTAVMIARHLGITLKQFNPNFSMDTFLEACEPTQQLADKFPVHPLTIAYAEDEAKGASE